MLSALSFTRSYIHPASTPIAPYGALPPAAGGSISDSLALVNLKIFSRDVADVRVLFCGKPTEKQPQNSQKMRRIFEDRTAALGASGAEAVGIR